MLMQHPVSWTFHKQHASLATDVRDSLLMEQEVLLRVRSEQLLPLIAYQQAVF